MKLVVGLGNPGSKYENTRHNVGFRVVDELSRRWGVDVGRRRFGGFMGDGSVGSERVMLLKPATYMNRSGLAVREAVGFYKIAFSDVLVVVDDLALPVGRLRFRSQGSAGGHNGLVDIIRHLGSEAFSRLRIGIGQVGGERMVGHVLGPFSGEEEEIVAPAIVRAAEAVEYWLREGVDQAMNRYNRADEPTGGSEGSAGDNCGGAQR